MICLACGADNPFGQESCWNCAEVFEVPPPHSRPDHVGQVQAALVAHVEGRLGADELLSRWQRFLDLAQSFAERWSLHTEGALEPRLDPLLRQRFAAPVAEVDAAWNELGAAVEEMEGWSQDGEPARLEAVRLHLDTFFRRSCAAAAWLDQGLRELGGEGGASGALVDLRSD